MADEKVYGIAESKSKVEVPRKSDVYTKDETYSKTEVYPKVNTYSSAYINATFLKKEDGAPTSHASTFDEYGAGTTTKFGHCKLTTSLDAPSGNQDGIALAGSMGYTLKTYIDSITAPLQTAVAALQAAVAAVQIPVGGIASLSDYYSDMSVVAQKMGYGTWLYYGSITAAALPNALFFYKRER